MSVEFLDITIILYPMLLVASVITVACVKKLFLFTVWKNQACFVQMLSGNESNRRRNLEDLISSNNGLFCLVFLLLIEFTEGGNVSLKGGCNSD